MSYMNAHTEDYNMTLHWSTPRGYMASIHATNRSWPLKTDDFESYAIGPDQYLVGFYSSRPDLKGFVRLASVQLRSAQNQLAAAVIGGANVSGLADLKTRLDTQIRALSVVQHHDAITSTQRRHVHKDYIRSLSAGQAEVGRANAEILSKVLGSDPTSPVSLSGGWDCGGVSCTVTEFTTTPKTDPHVHTITPINITVKPNSKWSWVSGAGTFDPTTGHIHLVYQMSAGGPTQRRNGTVSLPNGCTIIWNDESQWEAKTCVQSGFASCFHLNMSVCDITTTALTSGNVTIVVTNPTSATLLRPLVKFPVPSTVTNAGDIRITDNTGKVVQTQLLAPWPTQPHIQEGKPVIPAPMLAFELPGTLGPFASQVFVATRLGSYDAKGGRLVSASAKKETSVQTGYVDDNNVHRTRNGGFVLENDKLRVEFDAQTNLLARIIRKDLQASLDVLQEVRYYQASDGSTGPWAGKGASGSGNYIFQPASNVTSPLTPSSAPTTATFTPGPLVSEVRHVFVSGIEQVFRLHSGADMLEIEYRLGPLNISDGIGKEIVATYSTNMNTNATWAVDGNGLRLYHRHRNARAPLWPGGPGYFSCTDDIACNYFAANTLGAIYEAENLEAKHKAGKRHQLTVLVDRSQGCSSVVDGRLEFMLHRRLTHGCRWGMCEDGEHAGLNDVLGAEVVARHWVGLDLKDPHGDAVNSSYRMRSRELNYPLALAFAANLPAAVHNHDPLHGSHIPLNLEVTTFEALSDTSILLRVTHMFGPSEHPTLSATVTVTWDDLLGPVAASRITSIQEMVASADAPLGEVQRLSWKVAGEQGEKESIQVQSAVNLREPFTMHPTDIRTFVLLL